MASRIEQLRSWVGICPGREYCLDGKGAAELLSEVEELIHDHDRLVVENGKLRQGSFPVELL